MRVLLLALLLAISSPANAEQLWEKFSGAKAFAHAKALVDLGPRPAGSEALEKSRAYLTTQLEAAGWRVTRQQFSESTPRGEMKFVNLFATFDPAISGRPTFLLCSHYDTKTFETFRFVGANDGASGNALLLEMARVLSTQPSFAEKVELIFFDGEEAFENFTEIDGLYGSRYFAQHLGEQAKQFRGGMLFDMIGDKDLVVTLPPDSPENLARGIFAAADALKARNHFTYFDRDVTDDHTPLNVIGIPVIDLIDFDFPAWHTEADTLDKISAESLEIVGRTALYDLATRALK